MYYGSVDRYGNKGVTDHLSATRLHFRDADGVSHFIFSKYLLTSASQLANKTTVVRPKRHSRLGADSTVHLLCQKR